MTTTLNAEQLKKKIVDGVDLILVDVRRTEDFDADPRVIPGATWYDLEQIDTWSPDLGQKQEIVIYCAHGRSRSKAAWEKFTSQGKQVHLLEGGFDAWKESGGKLISP